MKVDDLEHQDRRAVRRLSAILAVLRRERPDLLALQELRDFERHDGRRMREVAEALGMTAHLAPSAFGQPVAVLARPPLELTRTGCGALAAAPRRGDRRGADRGRPAAPW